MKPIRGSCLCSGIRWEVSGTLSLMGHCHCSMCRKTHGAAFSTDVAAHLNEYRVIQGEDLIASYQSSPGRFRYFCSTCGSCLPDADPSSNRVFIPAGCLDDDPQTRPLAHIFVAFKAPWYEFTDELPRFDAFPPDWPAPSIERDIEQAEYPAWARGSCLCGDIAFEIMRGPAQVINCHCSRCRKARSAAYASNLFTEVTRFRWLRGEESIFSFKVPDAKSYTHFFCQKCGSSVPSTGRERVFVPMGTLDDDPGTRPQMHIFCDSKAPWFAITDNLPQYATKPGASPNKS